MRRTDGNRTVMLAPILKIKVVIRRVQKYRSRNVLDGTMSDAKRFCDR